MSFLLDALDKADNDRNRTKVNELKTPVQRKKTFLRRILTAQLVIALILASFAAGYYARPYIDGAESDAANEAAAGEQLPGKLAQAAAKIDGDIRESAAAPQSLPSFDIKLSAISYSTVPATRFAMINGFVMYEGDELATGERLKEIQSDSIVMSKGESEIRIALIQN